MPYHEDLKPLGSEGSCGWPLTLAVGWLAAGHEFATGSVPTEALERLRLLHAALNGRDRILVPAIAAGLQDCDFCAADGRRHGENMELWVRGPDGQAYEAPAMIVHYIEAHGYRPPIGFIEAVLLPEIASDLIDSQAGWAAELGARFERCPLRFEPARYGRLPRVPAPEACG